MEGLAVAGSVWAGHAVGAGWSQRAGDQPAGRTEAHRDQGRKGPLGVPWELSLLRGGCPPQRPAPPGVVVPGCGWGCWGAGGWAAELAPPLSRCLHGFGLVSGVKFFLSEPTVLGPQRSPAPVCDHHPPCTQGAQGPGQVRGRTGRLLTPPLRSGRIRSCWHSSTTRTRS